jgi:hypothetical protein
MLRYIFWLLQWMLFLFKTLHIHLHSCKDFIINRYLFLSEATLQVDTLNVTLLRRFHVFCWHRLMLHLIYGTLNPNSASSGGFVNVALCVWRWSVPKTLAVTQSGGDRKPCSPDMAEEAWTDGWMGLCGDGGLTGGWMDRCGYMVGWATLEKWKGWWMDNILRVRMMDGRSRGIVRRIAEDGCLIT